MEKIRVIELFAGIGACSKALEKLGYDVEILDAVEIDKYAIKSFNAIHNTNFEAQDIIKWNKYFENVDIITHGSPCQDFSIAGKQAGGDIGSGTRSSLMYETIRIVEKIRPKYVLWENVKNLLSQKHKHNFDAYIETMNNLGYTSYYQVLNAKDYGIPQSRERVYTISIRNDASKEFVFPQSQELKLRLKDMLDENVEEKYYLSKEKIISISHWKSQQKPLKKVQGRNSIVPTLTARGAGEEHGGMIIYSNSLENTTDLQELQIITHEFEEKVLNEIRKITPKECWRLMGFDDKDFEKAQKVNSNCQLYKQAGNSIVVNVLQAIFKNLFKEWNNGNKII